MLLAVALIAAFQQLALGMNGVGETLGALFGIGCPVILGCVILAWRDVAQEVLSARNPDDCWTNAPAVAEA